MPEDPQETVKPEDILTTGQIAKFCAVDPRTVNRWIHQNLLVSHALPITHFRRIKVKDFLRFLKAEKMPVPEILKGISKNRILIVDDDPSVRNAIRRVLHQAHSKDYEIETASEGFEAGRILQKFQPDLVILDLKMPKMDGFEVCRQIKTHPETRHIKVLAMSGTVRKEEYQKALDLGADSFLEKPFSEQVLKDRLLQLFGLEESRE